MLEDFLYRLYKDDMALYLLNDVSESACSKRNGSFIRGGDLRLPGLDLLSNHCLWKRNTQRIDLSAEAHHTRKVGFVFLRGMHYSKHLR